MPPFRFTRSDIPIDLRITGAENEHTFSICESYHTSVKVYRHDNPTPEILDRRVVGFLPSLVHSSTAGALKYLQAREKRACVQ